MLSHLLTDVVGGRIRHEELRIMDAVVELHKLELCLLFYGN